VEPEETAAAGQRLDKHVPAAMDTYTTTEELLVTMFPMWFMLRLYGEDERGKLVAAKRRQSWL
jgi:hypothetical protein